MEGDWMPDKLMSVRAINAIRFLAIDGVQQANAGHPGMPMGAAPMAFTLWTQFLRHNPKDPMWPNRDRFVLSAGHGSMLLYALLYLTGYDLPLSELERFRQLGSKTPGHPEYGLTPGVETTTGPLAQGFATAVGMAMAEVHLAARYNRPNHPVVDHYTYGIVSDGDLMEGLSGESASLAGHLGLGKIIFLYDDNHISIEGKTEITFTEDVLKRFDAYGWHTQRVTNGTDTVAIAEAIAAAQLATDRPSLIAVRTHIAEGSPNKHDSASAHGSPLGVEEVRLTRENLGWTDGPFQVPDDIRQFFLTAQAKGEAWQRAWQDQVWAPYAGEYPDLARELEQAWRRGLPSNWDQDLPVSEVGSSVATRSASGAVLNALAAKVPSLFGGSADLSPSTDTYLKGAGDFSPQDYAGKNIHFGVREHAMAAALNGMTLHGGLRVFGGTFLIFSDYCKPAIRLSALMHQPVVYVFTHDSIGLGEDGPTHQPIEQLAGLRAIPGLWVVRPADANETREAWKVAMTSVDHPVALVLSRQKLPVLPIKSPDVAKGAYIARDSAQLDVILMATGSEVSLAFQAAEALDAQGVGVRVVSMPSWELFDQMPEAYRQSVLPPAVTARVAIEAASPMGWARFVGPQGRIVAMNSFGESGRIEDLLPHFGFTVDHVVSEARAAMAAQHTK
jgi:transketolase